MYHDLLTLFIEGPKKDFDRLSASVNDGTFGRSFDLKAAVDCSSSLFHFHEHIYHLRSDIAQEFKKPKAYKLYLQSLYIPFAIVEDIANCSKHAKLDRNPVFISKASQIFESIVITTYQDNLGKYRNVSKTVFATADTNPNVKIDLVKLLDVTRFLLECELYRLDILPYVPSPMNERHPSRDEANINKMNLRLNSMTGAKLMVQFRNINLIKPKRVSLNTQIMLDLEGDSLLDFSYLTLNHKFNVTIGPA